MACILEVDSPSYPPTEEEYGQCGCPQCEAHLKRLYDAKELLQDALEEIEE